VLRSVCETSKAPFQEETNQVPVPTGAPLELATRKVKVVIVRKIKQQQQTMEQAAGVTSGVVRLAQERPKKVVVKQQRSFSTATARIRTEQATSTVSASKCRKLKLNLM